MKIKPQGKHLKAYRAGRKAFREGKLLSDNPMIFQPDVAMSSWWVAGWQLQNVKK